LKTSRIFRAILLFLFCLLAAAAQSTFALLERWEAALRSGNQSALAAFYS